LTIQVLEKFNKIGSAGLIGRAEPWNCLREPAWR
jgi:hypothetical protein